MRGRLIPIAALVALLATASAMRLSRRRDGGHGGSGPAAAGRSASPTRAEHGLAGLGAAPAIDGGRVVARGARMVHGDPRHTHRAAGRGPTAAKLAWSTAVGGAVEAQVTASPDESTLYVASLDGTLTALARDGSKRWSRALGGPGDRVYSTPCVGDDGTIYVGSDAKRFHAVGSDGRVVWSLEVGGEADTGAAVARDGSLVFAAGNVVYDVRKGGDVAWRFAAHGKVFTAPAIADDGTVVFGAQDHRVYALTASGALLWSTDLGADVDGAPAIADDGAIFVGTDGDEVVRLDARGDVEWRAPVLGFVRGALSVARNGDVLAGTFGPTPRAVRLTASGLVRGAFAVPGTGAREFGVLGGAMEDDAGTLYFGAQDDVIRAVGPDGALLWSFTTGADVDAPLTLLSSGELVAGSDDGKVYLFAP